MPHVTPQLTGRSIAASCNWSAERLVVVWEPTLSDEGRLGRDEVVSPMFMVCDRTVSGSLTRGCENPTLFITAADNTPRNPDPPEHSTPPVPQDIARLPRPPRSEESASGRGLVLVHELGPCVVRGTEGVFRTAGKGTN